MGVDGLSKIVKPVREVKLQEFRGSTFAIDAMIEIYRALKGHVVLTNKQGEKTHHINSLLSLILKLESYGIKQIWVFDHDVSKDEDSNEHFKYKLETLEMRRNIKAKNKEKYNAIKQKTDEIESKILKLADDEKAEFEKLFEGLENVNLTAAKVEMDNLQKRIESPERKQIEDLKLMLDTLGIEWVEAPITYEGEATCADLVKAKIANYAFTPDMDAILYGAPNVIRRVGSGKDTKFFLYNLDEIQGELNVDHNELIKIGLCIGTDANKKGIKGIGIKTVMTKYSTATDWSAPPYSELVEMFSRTYDVSQLEFHNIKSVSFSSEQQKNMIDWLVDKQNFNRDRIVKQFSNALANIKIGEIEDRTPVLSFNWDNIKFT